MYLTLLIITSPIAAANNRGENVGNLQTLQKLTTKEGMLSLLSGVSIKYAIRDAMQADGAYLWREVLDEPEEKNNAGYGYWDGKKRVAAMVDAIPKSANDFDDTILFGYMVAKKGDGQDANKQRGNVEVSNAISTTTYDGDISFHQGLKAGPSKSGTMDLAPFSVEKHLTRYQFTVTANLKSISKRPKAMAYLLESLKSLRVGGSHASNATEVSPAIVAWRFHTAPGRGGLYLGMGLNIQASGQIDIAPLKAHCANLGITDYKVAGIDQDMTVDAALKEMLKDSNAKMASLAAKSTP